MSTFVLDSNFFIQSHRDSYPLDVAVSFWEKVKILSHKGEIISIDKVYDEVYKYHGELKAW